MPSQLRELKAFRKSVSGHDKWQKLSDRLDAGARPEWLPFLREMAGEPAPSAKPGSGKKAIDDAADAQVRQGLAVHLLGYLKDEASMELLAERFLKFGIDWDFILLGSPSVERMAKFLLDPSDPLRAKSTEFGAKSTAFARAASHVSLSKSPAAASVLLAFGRQNPDEPCVVADHLPNLAATPVSQAAFKAAYLSSLANGRPCWARSAMTWGDPTVVEWMLDQTLGFRLESREIMSVAVALAEVGDAQHVARALSTAKELSASEDDTRTIEAHQLLAKRCGTDMPCYLKLAVDFKGPQDDPLRYSGVRALWASLRSRDARTIEAFLTSKIGPLVRMQPLGSQMLKFVEPSASARLSPPSFMKARLQFLSDTQSHTLSESLKSLLGSPPPEVIAQFPKSGTGCELTNIDWKNGTYSIDKATVRLTNGGSEGYKLIDVEYGTVGPTRASAAIVSVHDQPTYSGGSGKYMIGTTTDLVFTIRECKVLALGSLPAGYEAKFHDGLIEKAPFRFTIAEGRLLPLEAQKPKGPPKPCSKACTYNANCDVLANGTVSAGCCDSVVGPEFAADCRRRRGD